jgi:putative endonuclease
MREFYVYILASAKNGTLYIGIANNLERRVSEHRSNLTDGFTKEYQVHKLVYCEQTLNVEDAIKREKQLKKWRRQWKINLIYSVNPNWDDLYEDIARVGGKDNGFPPARE